MVEEIQALGKVYLERLIYNPVVLARRKVVALLEFADRPLTLAECRGHREVHEALAFYRPAVDLSQFWTFESNYSTEAALRARDLLEVEVELEIVDPGRFRADRFWKALLAPEATLFFNNLTADQLKQWIHGRDFEALALAAASLLFNLLSRYLCLREGTRASPESACYRAYDGRAGLDWRFLFFQQASLYLVAASYCLRNAPLALCLFYVGYALACHLVRSQVVFLVFRLRLFAPVAVEVAGQEHLPRNHVYAILTSTCLVSLLAVGGMLWSELRARAAFPDLAVLGDFIYMLQFLNSIHALALVVSAYRAERMDRLPWRLLAVKGAVNLLELLAFDLGELPSFAMTSYVRDDFVLLAALVFRLFAHEGRRYEEKMRYLMARQRYLEDLDRREAARQQRPEAEAEPTQAAN